MNRRLFLNSMLAAAAAPALPAVALRSRVLCLGLVPSVAAYDCVSGKFLALSSAACGWSGGSMVGNLVFSKAQGTEGITV